jgi:hypothetical protein
MGWIEGSSFSFFSITLLSDLKIKKLDSVPEAGMTKDLENESLAQNMIQACAGKH